MAKDYQERKDQVNEIQTEQRRKGRDIAPLPRIKNPQRREDCRVSLQLFCETYFPAAFYIRPWSPAHLRLFEVIQRVTVDGGLNANALPRGSGKSTICKAAMCWAVFYGYRFYGLLVGATNKLAKSMLKWIKDQIETNELLLEDFPEICYPIRRLEGRANNAPGQLLDGERTRVSWTDEQIVLPTVRGSCASGSVLGVSGMEGSIRGLSVNRAWDGQTLRPDFTLIDDPQTKESARSLGQIDLRLSIIRGDILQLGGPGKKMASVMPCTVIAKDDVADQVLDRTKSPDWQGERVKMLNTLPTDLTLWEQYAEIRAQSIRTHGNISEATEFYRTHQKAMDAGAEATWPERYEPDELSGIQYAMNKRIFNESMFQAEYQNDPLGQVKDVSIEIKPDDILAKVNGIPRSRVPDAATTLTAFIDVQGELLYYMVVAFEPDFTAHVIDYGSYPDQKMSYFRLRGIKKKLSDIKKDGKRLPREAAITAGLDALTRQLIERDWDRQTKVNGTAKISRLYIDSGNWTEVIRSFVKSSKYRALILPTQGRAVEASFTPMNEWPAKVGERKGQWWRIRPNERGQYDTNQWKSFVSDRIFSNPGMPGNLSLFAATETQHKLVSEHLSAEYAKPDDKNGRTVNEWKILISRGGENHLWDCLIGCYVAASEMGVTVPEHKTAALKNKRKVRKRLEVKW